MSLQKALNNIFKEDESPSKAVQVVEVVGPGRFKTKDVYGRVWVVLSDQKWAVDDFVTIQTGRIVGTADAFPALKIFTV